MGDWMGKSLSISLIYMRISKGKGIQFIVLYPPKRSHDLPLLAGLYTQKPFQSPIAEQLAAYSAHTLSTALFMLGTLLQLGRLKQYGINCLAQEQTKVPRPRIEPATLWLLVGHLTNWATLSPVVELTLAGTKPRPARPCLGYHVDIAHIK